MLFRDDFIFGTAVRVLVGLASLRLAGTSGILDFNVDFVKALV